MVTKYRAVLSIPGCPRLLASALLARLPQGMSSLAILLLVRSATHSYPAAGIAVGAFAFAAAAGSPLQGRLVDRHGRARVVVPAALLQGCVIVAFVLAAGAGAPSVLLVVLAAADGALVPAVAPSVRALLGEVITDRETRETAYALESVIQELIWITGPLVVAIMVAVASASAALLVTAVVCIAGTALFVTAPLARRPPATDPLGGRSGALAIPELRALLGPMMLMGASLGATEVGIPSLALHAGSRPLSGLLLAAWSLGSLTGGLLYGSRSWQAGPAERFRILMVAAALCTAPLIAARTIPEGLVCSLLAGVSIAPAFSCLYALVGRVVTPGIETEAFTWAASALIVGLSVGSAIGGVAIGAVGVSGPFVVACVASVMASLLGVRARGRVGAVV
jgi:MFS family permease